jgi:cytoskeletal protein CcmA (bactofilin family)
MRVEGELQTDGVVKIEGTVVGSVRAQQQVLVAKGGVVEGDVHTREAILGGEVHGSILAYERVEVQASSVVHGDITTQRIVVHEGGEVNGHVRMGDPRAMVEAAEDGEDVAEMPHAVPAHPSEAGR